jgi:hypothetical protein
MGISSVSSSQSSVIRGSGYTSSQSSVNGRDTGMESKLKSLGLSPEANKTVMETLKSGKAGSADLGAALESKLKAQGVSDDKIKSVLTALNGGKAKVADSTDSTDSTDATDSTSSSTSGWNAASKESIGAKLESILKGLGISDTQSKTILKALNGDQVKGASSSSNSSSASSNSSFMKSYNADSFTA